MLLLAAANPQANWSTDYCFDKMAYVCTKPKFISMAHAADPPPPPAAVDEESFAGNVDEFTSKL